MLCAHHRLGWTAFVKQSAALSYCGPKFSRRMMSAEWGDIPSSDNRTFERVTNGAQQCLFADGFAKKLDCARSESGTFVFLRSLSAQEDYRNGVAILREAALQFQAVHTRHSKVEDQAGCLSGRFRVQKFFSGCKSLSSEPGGAEKSSG